MILASNYVGVVQFGTEQKFSTSNVTFTVHSFAMDARRGIPKEAAGASLEFCGWRMTLVSLLVASIVYV